MFCTNETYIQKDEIINYRLQIICPQVHLAQTHFHILITFFVKKTLVSINSIKLKGKE